MNKFTTKVGSSNIKARDLDANFDSLRPLVSSQYGITQTSAGWQLDIFPAFPENVRTPCALGYINGEMGWYPLELFQDPPPAEADTFAEIDNTVPEEEPEDNSIPDPVMIMYYKENTRSLFVKLSEFISTINASEFGPEETTAAFNQILAAYTSTTGREWAIRTVERCDGKRMDVFGTDWYTP